MTTSSKQPSSTPLLLSELCPYCNLQPPKYRCPACNARSCSLSCSKRHKIFNQCTGIRDPAKYVKRAQLLTPTALDRDYNYLNTVGKAITHPPIRYLNEVIDEELKERTVRLKRVLSEVEDRGVNIIQAPAGIKRARENKTAVTGSKKRRKTLKWTIEWIIREGEKERRVLDERVPENLRLSESISPHLDAESKSERRRKLDSLHVYLKDVTSSSTQPTLISIAIDKSLREILQGKTVVEFPTIYVCDKVPEDFTVGEHSPQLSLSSSEEEEGGEEGKDDNAAAETTPVAVGDGSVSEDIGTGIPERASNAEEIASLLDERAVGRLTEDNEET